MFSGVSVKYNPDGKSVKDIVNCSYSINFESDGTYTVTYTPIGEEYLEEEVTRTVEVGMEPVTLNYAFDSAVPYYTLPQEYKGLNKFDLYGSKGSSNYGGNGGYSTGTLNSLSYDGDLYLYLGGMSTETVQAGYNGGGKGYYYQSSYRRFNGGGGATDIRLVNGVWNNQTSLASRIMVAGGGGGYYGGGTSASVDGYRQTGSGGSGYISGHAGCIAIKSATDITPKVQTYSQLSDSYHYSGLIFKNTSMTNGNNSGAGKANITA